MIQDEDDAAVLAPFVARVPSLGRRARSSAGTGAQLQQIYSLLCRLVLACPASSRGRPACAAVRIPPNVKSTM